MGFKSLRGLTRFITVVLYSLFWPFFSRYKIIFKFPFVIQREIPFIFLVYPGTRDDVWSYFPKFLPEGLILFVRSILGPIFPIGRLGEGFVFATFYSVDEVEDSSQVASTLFAAINNLKKTTDSKIAIAGRMPGVLINAGYSGDVFVNGSTGTVHACIQAFLNLLCRREIISFSLSVAVIGAKGFVGKRVVDRLKKIGFINIYGFDPRYERDENIDGVYLTSDFSKISECRVAIVLSAKGEQFLDYVEHLEPESFILDDTHPQLPPSIVAALEERGVFVYKVALSLEGMFFSPPIPGYKQDWLPGCVWEALILSSSDKFGIDVDIDDEYERFMYLASILKFSPVLAYHFFENYSA